VFAASTLEKIAESDRLGKIAASSRSVSITNAPDPFRDPPAQPRFFGASTGPDEIDALKQKRARTRLSEGSSFSDDYKGAAINVFLRT